jgi:uncharacterized repeat protein (TIGR01451 family)
MRASHAHDCSSRRQRRPRGTFRGALEALERRIAPATFVVNSIFDQPAADPTVGAETSSGQVTLRSAIQAANLHPNDATGPDRIEFNIPGSGVQMIAPFSSWPAITDPVVIDGYTQPGAKANTLDVGDNAVLKINLWDRFGFGGLTIKAGNSTVRGLDFTNFTDHGLAFTGKGGNVVAGNFFGMPPSGSPSITNIVALSVGFGADGNTIGGTAPSDRNVISGNAVGLRIVASSNNVVQGNYFGLDISRDEPLGNGQSIIVTSGVAGEMTGPATGNLIGGTVAGARNIISGSGAGIVFGGDQADLTSGNLVQGNYIGTNVIGAGNAHFHNDGPGILLDTGTGNNTGGARMNTIGGSTAAARNIISNSNVGIQVATGATDNLIQGNYIGTEVTGTAMLGNSTAGIEVHGERTTILDNLVSGNRVDGIFIQGGDESIIQGNLIGTNAAGTASVQNQWGIHLSGSNHVTIGGTTAGARNVVSGNQRFGVSLEDFGVGNRIEGNFIGTDVAGTGPLGNAVDGIFINYNFSGRPSGDTLIGGPDPGAGNIIAFNGIQGVDIRNSTMPNQADGTIEANTIHSNVLNGILIATLSASDPHYRITRNSIYSNGSLGIDLGDDGVTPNDSRGHAGPNNYQDFPVLTTVAASAAATDVSGSVHGPPNSQIRIEFFANAEPDPGKVGQGEIFLGTKMVATDASGNATFDHVSLPSLPPGRTLVTATATDGAGNTSEFSTTVQSTPSQTKADLSVTATATPSPVDPGGTVTYSITVTNHGPDAAANANLATAVPSATTFQSFAAPAGWTVTAPAVGSTGDVSAMVPHLDSGESAVFSFVVHVDSGAQARATLVAEGSVGSETNDPDASNNTWSVPVVISAAFEAADLALEAAASPPAVEPGQLLSFTFTATNHGRIAATNVNLSIDVPGQTSFQSLAAPAGWTVDTRSVEPFGIAIATIPSIGAGASAVFTLTVRVSTTAPGASVITARGRLESETVDPDESNNRAEASANVVAATSAGVTVAISGDIDPASVGKAVTYTIRLTNPGNGLATGTVAHVTVPTTASLLSLGGGARTVSGVDLAVSDLRPGETKQYQIVASAQAPGSITLTVSATADPGVAVGSPASVTTDFVGAASPGSTPAGTPGSTPAGTPGSTPAGTPSAVRYGFHRQPTILVVTFPQVLSPGAAADARNYAVLVPARGNRRSIPIRKAWYNASTHQSTLRMAQQVYLYRPWTLVVRGGADGVGSNDSDVGGAKGGDFATTMDVRSLRGPAWDAPGASHVGVRAVPAGPAAAWASHVARAVSHAAPALARPHHGRVGLNASPRSAGR